MNNGRNPSPLELVAAGIFGFAGLIILSAVAVIQFVLEHTWIALGVLSISFVGYRLIRHLVRCWKELEHVRAVRRIRRITEDIEDFRDRRLAAEAAERGEAFMSAREKRKRIIETSDTIDI